MSTLYFYEQGTRLSLKQNCLNDFSSGSENAVEVPFEQVEAVVLFGKIEATSAVFTHCLERGIPVSWLSHRGKYYGRLQSTEHVNIEKKRLQFACENDADFRNQIAAQILSAKVHNQRIVLEKIARRRNDLELDRSIKLLEHYSNSINTERDISRMMGLEGTAAKLYFTELGKSVPESFSFKGRNRRPPRDPFNSLLSFAYTLLIMEMVTQIENAGLDPYAGLIHVGRQSNPALACDLIEEWRGIAADVLVLSLINHRQIKADDFDTLENDGVYANRKTAEIFVRAFQEKMNRPIKSFSEADDAMNFREAASKQIGFLFQAMRENNPSLYSPVRYR